MSISSRTLRTLSCSTVPGSSKTLVPFLYQTATIQQWASATRPLARRTIASRSRHNDDIPFEDEALPPRIDNAGSARKSTITGPERAAFEKLYKRFNSDGQPQDDIPFKQEIGQVADEYFEDDDKDTSTSLDSLFDAVLSRLPFPDTRAPRLKKKPAENVSTTAQGILKKGIDGENMKAANEGASKKAKIKARREEERARVSELLENARTDRQLWEILDREVFDPIRRLDLDGLKPAAGRKTLQQSRSDSTANAESTSTASEPDPSRSDPRILFPNYPYHLIVAVRLLRTNFPTSQLPLAILPTIKSLGRSSYALGATTTLYRLLIRTAWIQHASYDYIDELLRDMDNGGMEIDHETLNLLEEILLQFSDARAGRFGLDMKMVWRMEQFSEGIKKVRAWRDTVAGRLGIWGPNMGGSRTVRMRSEKASRSSARLNTLSGRDTESSIPKDKPTQNVAESMLPAEQN